MGGRLYFARFETRRMDAFIAHVKQHHIASADTIVCGTGGGALKFGPVFEKVPQVTDAGMVMVM